MAANLARKVIFGTSLLRNSLLHRIPFVSNISNKNQNLVSHCKCLLAAPAKSFHTSGTRGGLDEFFDHKDNWGESSVKVGRPWLKDELRLKSNSDLHKLWYVLLKERNMLLTMEHLYKEDCELFPNPERIDKVEESMENLVFVVNERDRAYHLLETGKPNEPQLVWKKNILGMTVLKRETEHYVPKHKNQIHMRLLQREYRWNIKYKKLYREKMLLKYRMNKKCERRALRGMEDAFPHLKLSD